MAGDWIKMRADLFTHPKVFNIADALGKDELYVVGALLAFWSWAHSHAVDGRVDGATSTLVDRATRAPGLSNALVAVGWLEIDDQGVTIPRFDIHNGDSAKERALKNQRQARWRGKKSKENVDAQPSTDASTDASTREEKRREDISITEVIDRGAKRATRKCPADFTITDDMREWARVNAPRVDADKATDAFRDHTFKNAISDWRGAWRNWLRRDQEFAKKASPIKTTNFISASDKRKAWADALIGGNDERSDDIIDIN